MKKVLVISIIIALVLILIFISRSKKINTDSQVPQIATQDLSPQTLTENQKALSVSESTFAWTGKKTIIKDWVDTGSVRLLEGFITTDKDMVVGGQAIVDMTSITAATTGSGSGQDKLSEHLKSADFFDAASYPTATIVIKRIAEGIAYSEITIKGITRSVEFPVSISKDDNTYMIAGNLPLNRTWFDVKFGSKAFFSDLVDKMVIDDVFTLDFKVVTQ